MGQAVPGNHLHRNSVLSRDLWFSNPKVRPDPVFGPRVRPALRACRAFPWL